LILEPRFKMTEKTHGGARSGAGRKPGSIRKATAAAQAKAAETGILPLDFMLDRMRNDQAPMEDRMDMAKAAAPYVHAKLSSIEANLTADVEAVTRIELVGVLPG
jgi:hypothetical protein